MFQSASRHHRAGFVPLLVLAISGRSAGADDVPLRASPSAPSPIAFDISGLPPRSLSPALPDRPIPSWLRVNPDGKTDGPPNFANVRSGYRDWLLAQLAWIVRT